MMSSPDDGSGEPMSAERRRLVLFCTIPLAVFTVASFIGSAFMPYFLARAPLALVALSPLFRHFVLVAPSVDPLFLYLVGVPRHFASDPFMYLLGREFGTAALEWVDQNSPLAGRLARLLERLFGKIGFLALVVSPDIIVSALAGVARIPFWLFVAANIAGTFLTIAVARYFGAAFESPIRAMVAFFSAHLLVVTVVSVVSIVAINWFYRKREPDTNADGS
ncbi:MAG TPA: hypothetical protein VH062_21590 [Polyangiaceae bacterium]|jgi:membrane protein DedA with SNARE-associated domain|nr:hypothetical protein [Polyangiaceae bacterium]